MNAAIFAGEPLAVAEECFRGVLNAPVVGYLRLFGFRGAEAACACFLCVRMLLHAVMSDSETMSFSLGAQRARSALDRASLLCRECVQVSWIGTPFVARCGRLRWSILHS